MKKLLIVVDFQKDFVDGALGFPGAEKLEEPICRKLAEYQANGWDIAFTYDTHGEDYLETQEGRKLPVPHCVKGTEGWKLYGAVSQYDTGSVHRFLKPAFGSPELALFAAGGGYDEVEFCGLVSNICVLSNAVQVKAALPEARIRVDARCTDSFDKALHEKALDVMEGLQIEVYGRSNT